MIKIILAMSQPDPYPGAPMIVIAILKKTFSGSLNVFCSRPKPADAKASRLNFEATSLT